MILTPTIGVLRAAKKGGSCIKKKEDFAWALNLLAPAANSPSIKPQRRKGTLPCSYGSCSYGLHSHGQYIANIVMAYILMAYIVMAYTVMAYTVMAYTGMAYTVMAYTVMAWSGL